MAEKNHLRIADQNDLPNDDPFAELTRIMGFDPRQPVRQQPAEAPAQDPSGAVADEDDFGIDLEKELMGELEAEEAAPEAEAAFQPAEAAYKPATEPAAEIEQALAGMDEASFATAAFEDELAASLDADAQQELADPVSEDQLSAAFEEEFSLADDFAAADDHSHVAAAETSHDDDFEGETAFADDQPFEHVLETGTEAELADDAVEAQAFAPGEEAQAFEAGEEAGDFAFEDAMQEELARGLADAPSDAEPAADLAGNGAFEVSDEQESPSDDSWEPAAEYDEPVVDEEVSAQPVAMTPEQAPADDFDAALAEVDMDFSAAKALHAADTALSAEDDLDSELHLRLSEPTDYDYAPTATVEAEEPEPDELSLEDELNALLGNTHGRSAPVAEAPTVEAPAVEAVQAPAETAEAAEAETAEAENVEDGLLDDLAGDLDAVNWAFEASAEPAEAQVPSASEEDLPLDEAAVSSDDADHGWDLDEQVTYATQAVDDETDFIPPADAEFGDIDLAFDDEAFDAAISNAIADDDSAASERQEPERAVVDESNDPYAALAALTASMRSTEPAKSWRQEAAAPAMDVPAEQEQEQHEQDAEDQDDYYASAPDEDFPDIETVDVPEQAVALADDLDIPEVAFEENVPPQPAFDDLDAEFANLLNDMNSPEKTPAPGPAYQADDYSAEFERPFARQEQAHPVSSYAAPAAFAAGVAGGATFASASNVAYGSAAGDDDADYVPGSRQPEAHDQFAVDDLSYDPDVDEDMVPPEYAAATRETPQRRGMLVAAIVGGVAILGGLGAFAMSFGDGGSDAPAIVKADAEPVKVRPENPGGATVPNQDNKVYDSVAGAGGEAGPRQEKLLTSAEEPIEVPAPEPEPEPRIVEAAPADAAPADPVDAKSVEVKPVEQAAAPEGELPQALPAGDQPPALPQAKSEDRIEQVIQEAGVDNSVEVAAVAPRKVRTMIVKADGTLVPREDPAPAPEAAAAKPAPAAPTANAAEPPVPEATGAVPDAPVAAAPAATLAAAGAEAATDKPSSATPNSVPVAPARPSDQPVDIVGEVKGDQVAALNPASGANGAWSMQIASQPSEAAAQSSYQDLLRRYGSVLEGHQANIVKAEVAGKGTFWRVRVPAGSRSDAIKLCESYKSAGGNCFVSK
ncbi:MAG TPA: SPOR domain-containing protein [Pseudaminobacter sp.]|nr:SPOR domain-containing protein [Pseudaminobacter sp.]